MAGDTRLTVLFQILCFFLLLNVNNKAQGYYCTYDLCNYNEYCCGHDLCCDYLTGYWYIWILGGVMIFSFFMVCCWMRCRRASNEAVYRKSDAHGYVLYGSTKYGDPIYVHQQPASYQYGPSPTQTSYIPTVAKGDIPFEEPRQRQPASVQPPPYYSERMTPSAPPYNTPYNP